MEFLTGSLGSNIKSLHICKNNNSIPTLLYMQNQVDVYSHSNYIVYT